MIYKKNFTICLNSLHNFYLGKFGYCLMKHIVTILSRRSADAVLENISWIQNEAAMFASVNRTGTLRYINLLLKLKLKLRNEIYWRLTLLKADINLT